MSHPLLEHIKNAAASRNSPPVSDEHILAALRKIDANEVEVQRYPNGTPSLKAVYEIAISIEAAASASH